MNHLNRPSSDLYAWRADECLRKAAEARDPEDQEAWITLAEDWRRMTGDCLDGSDVLERRDLAA